MGFAQSFFTEKSSLFLKTNVQNTKKREAYLIIKYLIKRLFYFTISNYPKKTWKRTIKPIKRQEKISMKEYF